MSSLFLDLERLPEDNYGSPRKKIHKIYEQTYAGVIKINRTIVCLTHSGMPENHPERLKLLLYKREMVDKLDLMATAAYNLTYRDTSRNERRAE